MQTTTGTRARVLVSAVTAAALAIFGAATVLKGVDGMSTVRDSLRQEAIVGTPTMAPAAMQASAHKAGVRGLTVPSCAVAGTPIDDGASARCFAQYMRLDALIATGGKTYAQMPRFASADGKGTNIEAVAAKGPDGRPLNNPARQVWITETALSTALNTSYMAEQISLFGVAVGGAFLLVAFILGVSALRGAQLPRVALAGAGRRQPEGSVA